MWVSGIKKCLFDVGFIFLFWGEKEQVGDEESYVYSSLDKGETIGHGKSSCDAIFFKDDNR